MRLKMRGNTVLAWQYRTACNTVPRALLYPRAIPYRVQYRTRAGRLAEYVRRVLLFGCGGALRGALQRAGLPPLRGGEAERRFELF